MRLGNELSLCLIDGVFQATHAILNTYALSFHALSCLLLAWLQVAQESLECLFIGCTILPAGEVSDVSFASKVSSPLKLAIIDAYVDFDRKQNICIRLLLPDKFFFFLCCSYFFLHPRTVDRILRQNDQELIVKANGFFDTIGKFCANFQIFWGEPTLYSLLPQVSMQALCKFLIFTRVADETRVVLDRRLGQRTSIGDKSFAQTGFTQKYVRYISFRPFQRIGSDGRRTIMADFFQSLYGAKIKVSKNSPFYYCSAEVGSAEVGFAEVGYSKVGSIKNGSGKVGFAEVGFDKVGSAEIGSTKSGSGKVSFAEIGSAEVGNIKVGSSEVGSAEIGYSEVGFTENGSTESGFDEVGSSKVSSTEVSSAEVGSAEVGSTEISSTKYSSVEISFAKIGFAEVGSAEVGSAEVGPAKVGSAEVGSAEVDPAEVGSGKVGSGKVGSIEVNCTEVGFAEVNKYCRLYYSPGVPCCDAFLLKAVQLFLNCHTSFSLSYCSHYKVTYRGLQE
jgi:hypothetical protein